MNAISRETQQRGDKAPSADLLFAVATELSDLGRTGAMLQELVAGKVRTGSLSGMALLDAQDADLLVQRLTELAKFLQTYALGLQCNLADPLTPALNDVLLGALAQRLAPESDPAKHVAVTGDTEIF